MKNYMAKISDSNDKSADEEREILSRLTQECMGYFKSNIQDAYSKKLKDLVENDTKEIIKSIKGNLKNQNNEIKERIIKEVNDMNFFNIFFITI